MRVKFVAALTAISFLLSGETASAASRSEVVFKGFQTYVNNAKSNLITSKSNYDKEVAKINSTYATSISIAKATYDNEILQSKNLYEPQINSATAAIKDAKAKLLTVNQVKVLKQGSDRNKWGYLNCPLTRKECIYVDKGELFIIGEVTTLKSIVGENVDYLTGVQTMVDEGLIELLSPVEYQKAASVIRAEPLRIKALSSQWDAMDTSARNKLKGAEDSARLIAGGPLLALMERYEIDKAKYQEQITAGNLALRAAKRASKNKSFFDKAFITAFKFDYNAKGLDDVANLSFESLNTLRSFLSQFAIIELADKAAGVDGAYSYLAADRINKSVGNVFTVDIEFQAPAKIVALEYKRLTRVSLKF